MKLKIKSFLIYVSFCIKTFFLYSFLFSSIFSLTEEGKNRYICYQEYASLRADCYEHTGLTALHCACAHGDEEVISYLLQEDPGQTISCDRYKQLPATLAAHAPLSQEITKQLLETTQEQLKALYLLMSEQAPEQLIELICKSFLRFSSYEKTTLCFFIFQEELSIIINQNKSRKVFLEAALLSESLEKISFIENFQQTYELKYRKFLTSILIELFQPKDQLPLFLYSCLADERFPPISYTQTSNKENYLSILQLVFERYFHNKQDLFFSSLFFVLSRYETDEDCIEKILSTFEEPFKNYHKKNSLLSLMTAFCQKNISLIKSVLAYTPVEELTRKYDNQPSFYSLVEISQNDPLRASMRQAIAQKIFPDFSKRIQISLYMKQAERVKSNPIIIALCKQEYDIARYFILTEPHLLNSLDKQLGIFPFSCAARLIQWKQEYNDAVALKKVQPLHELPGEPEDQERIEQVDPQKYEELMFLMLDQECFDYDQCSPPPHENTVLHYAALSDRSGKIIKKIIHEYNKRGIPLLQKNNDAETPLLFAARMNNSNGYKEIYSHLIEKENTIKNFSLYEKNNDEDDALALATKNNNFDLIQFISKKSNHIPSIPRIQEWIERASFCKNKAAFTTIFEQLSIENYPAHELRELTFFAVGYAILFFDYELIKNILRVMQYNQTLIECFWLHIIPFAIEAHKTKIITTFLDEEYLIQKNKLPLIKEKSLLHWACSMTHFELMDYLEALRAQGYSFTQELLRKDDEQQLPLHHLALALKNKREELENYKFKNNATEEEQWSLQEEIDQVLAYGQRYRKLINKPLSFYTLPGNSKDLNRYRKKLAIQNYLKNFFLDEETPKTATENANTQNKNYYSTDSHYTDQNKSYQSTKNQLSSSSSTQHHKKNRNNKKQQKKKGEKVSNQSLITPTISLNKEDEENSDDYHATDRVIGEKNIAFNQRTTTQEEELLKPLTLLSLENLSLNKKSKKTKQLKKINTTATSKKTTQEKLIVFSEHPDPRDREETITLSISPFLTKEKLDPLLAHYLRNLNYNYLNKINNSKDTFHSFTREVEKQFGLYGKKVSEIDLTTKEQEKAYQEYAAFYDKIVQIDITVTFGSFTGNCEYIILTPSMRNTQAPAICLHRFFNKQDYWNQLNQQKKFAQLPTQEPIKRFVEQAGRFA